MVLTFFIKATLFIAVVTAFVLEALPDLKNMSTSDRPSSILKISGLWFGSIMSSLVATTWALACLEWCTPTKVTTAEDYGELAEKRHRRLEAIERWRMGLIVSAIPFFLYISLYTFLAGLWLRLRDINNEIGLIIGVPTLAMVSIHLVITLLPIFTEAPFPTSTSELIKPVFRGIRNIAKRCRFIRPPRLFVWVLWVLRYVFAWIPNLSQTLHRKLSSLLQKETIQLAIAFSKATLQSYRTNIPFVWQAIMWLVPVILPTYQPDPGPCQPHRPNGLELALSDSNNRTRLRALFWLMKMPLDRDQMKGILREFRPLSKTAEREPMDRCTIKILVLSMIYFLEDDEIGPDDEPLLHHCLPILAEKVEKVLGNEDLRGIYCWRSTPVLKKLLPHFHLDKPSIVPPAPSDEDLTHSYPKTINEEAYWLRKAIPALLFCPLPETVKIVADQLDSTEHLTKETLLRIVRGFHGTALACSDSNQSIIEEIPDLGIWSWDSPSLDLDLDRALLQFLRNLFETLRRDNHPPTTPCSTTTPSLVVSCLKILDEEPDRYHPKIHNALCLLAVVAWRRDPLSFNGEPSFTDDLLASVEFYKECRGEGGLNHARRLVARLRAIACGPKSLICKDVHPLTCLGGFFSGLHGSVTADKQCLKGFLDAHAATLEAMLLVNSSAAIFTPQDNADCAAAQEVLTNPFFTHHLPLSFVHGDPNWRLSYLYSLAIALTYAVRGWNGELFKVVELFVDHDENRVTLDRALDTNILVVAILGFGASRQPELTRNKMLKISIERLEKMIRNGTDWRTHWKSIYFIADLTLLLSRIGMLGEAEERFLIQAASVAFKQVIFQHLPSDWFTKQEGLRRCGLLYFIWLSSLVRGEAKQGVYEWAGLHNVPYLALYHPPPTTPQPLPRGLNWALTLAATMANKQQVEFSIKKRIVLIMHSQHHHQLR
jgi:hypothetical protein